MSSMNQREVAETLGLSATYFSNILCRGNRLSAAKAKEVEKISGIGRLIFLYGTKEEIKAALVKVYGEF